jgi:N-acetylglutamate synthase-like GNAT family acetyltransferase
MGTGAFEVAQPEDMPLIEDCIRRFRLDDEDLKAEQFILIRQSGRVVAFGRIKPYGRVYELGSVGVLEDRRGKGLGRRMTEELIRRFPSRDVYITTDLPAYFERLGFERIDTGPEEIFAKIGRVCGRLRTDVVAMVFRKGSGAP